MTRVHPDRPLTARGESPASHRGRRCARMARRDEREYREYLNEEQRSQPGCSAGRMQLDFHHGLLRSPAPSTPTRISTPATRNSPPPTCSLSPRPLDAVIAEATRLDTAGV